MNIDFRQRTLLLPLSRLLGAVSNLSTVKFTDADRERLLLSAIEELLWREYYVTPFKGTLQAPYVEGQFAWRLVAIIKQQRVNPETLTGEIAKLRAKIDDVIESLLFDSSLMLGALRIDVPWEPGHPPRIFDHGYTLTVVMPRGKREVSLGRWLQIRWLRPTVDWQEMSVGSYVNLLVKKTGLPRDKLNTTPLTKLLTRPESWAGFKKMLMECEDARN
ncbi:hypothetical protein MLDJOKPK_00072 [Salmonella phage SPAsTU]|nr:hypothetical protein MLDJOKPK_00072 [Salmonella phage SPAsTU]